MRMIIMYKLEVKPRNKALDIALVTTSNLQSAIDSGKHGAKGKDNIGITIQNVLYGTRENIITMVIHKNSTRERVMRLWTSVLPVSLKDIILSINHSKDNNTYDIAIDPMKALLYRVDIDYVLQYLEYMDVPYECHVELLPNEYSQKYKDYTDTFDINTHVIVSISDNKLSTDILMNPIRQGFYVPFETINNIRGPTEGESMGDVYTILKGCVIEEVINGGLVRTCDDVFSTDSTKNVEILGKVRTTELYSKYITGDNKELYIGSILYSTNKMLAYDFSTATKFSVTQGLTMEQQKKVITRACIDQCKETIDDIPEGEVLLGNSNT